MLVNGLTHKWTEETPEGPLEPYSRDHTTVPLVSRYASATAIQRRSVFSVTFGDKYGGPHMHSPFPNLDLALGKALESGDSKLRTLAFRAPSSKCGQDDEPTLSKSIYGRFMFVL